MEKKTIKLYQNNTLKLNQYFTLNSSTTSFGVQTVDSFIPITA